jgi:hypothetical protein
MHGISYRGLRHLGLVLLILSSSFGIAHERDDDDKKSRCEGRLESVTREKIAEAYNRYKKVNRAFGVDFRLKSGSTAPPVRIELGLSTSALDRSETWAYSNRFFRFLDVGFKNLEGEMKSINQAVAEHVLKFSDHDLLIDYSPERVETLSRLTQYRWFVQDAVLTRYRKLNAHVSDRDLFMLNWTDRRSFNSDILAVLMDDLGQPLSRQDVLDRLIVSLQINYPGFFDFLSPNLNGVLQSQSFQSPVPADGQLPFEFRLHHSIAKMFRFAVYERFPRDRTCELTQYSKFKSIPHLVQDRLMFEAFRSAARRNMKVIVVMANADTERQFRQYGFDRYLPFLAKQQLEPEHLIYLETDSEEFRYQLQRLKDSTKLMTVFKDD